jgi:hypothetical protein
MIAGSGRPTRKATTTTSLFPDLDGRSSYLNGMVESGQNLD